MRRVESHSSFYFLISVQMTISNISNFLICHLEVISVFDSDKYIHIFIWWRDAFVSWQRTIWNLSNLWWLTSHELNIMMIVHAFRLASSLHSHEFVSCPEKYHMKNSFQSETMFCINYRQQKNKRHLRKCVLFTLEIT